MSGEDSGFLAMDVDIQPMHAVHLALLEPAGAGEPLTLSELEDHLASRLAVLPSLRWRSAGGRAALTRPAFVEDRAFDLGSHLRQVHLEPPGGDIALDNLCASMAQRHLDLRRPLWEISLVDGLEGGRQALIVLLHHAIADGTATLTTLSRIFGEGGRRRDAGPKHVARAMPRRALVTRTARALRATKRFDEEPRASPAAPAAADHPPLCSLCLSGTCRRTYARARLRMADVRAVRAAAGVTVTDVILATVAGATRDYLLDRQELPGAPLVAGVPVALEPHDPPSRALSSAAQPEPMPPAAERQWGNRISGMNTYIASNVADPWERLLATSQAASAAKQRFAISIGPLVPDLLDHVPTWLLRAGTRLVSEAARSGKRPPSTSLFVSSLKGPERAWRIGSRSVEALYLAGPPTCGAGPNIVAWSYGPEMLVSVLAFADALADASELAGRLPGALEELRAAAGHATAAHATAGHTASGHTASGPEQLA